MLRIPKFSIITVISRPEVYDKCLLRSVNNIRSKYDIELIPIFNDGNRYSASVALNIGLSAARSDIVICAHQDVCLLPGWFDNLATIIDSIDDWGVIGSAGIALQYGLSDIGQWGGAETVETVAVGSVWDHESKLDQSPYWDGLKSLTQVHCIDECVFVVNKRTGLRFDHLFRGFHFYGVDLCLQSRAAAYPVYAADLPIIHYGQYSASFTGNNKYWVYLRLLHSKWHLRFPELLGTHFHWGTRIEIDTIKPELTSYISIKLDDGNGLSIDVQAMGLAKVRLTNDARYGLVN